MVPSGDAKTSDKIPKNGEEQGLPTKRSDTRANKADDRAQEKDGDVEPIELVAPV